MHLNILLLNAQLLSEGLLELLDASVVIKLVQVSVYPDTALDSLLTERPIANGGWDIILGENGHEALLLLFVNPELELRGSFTWNQWD